MSDNELFIYATIGFFVGIYFFFKGFKWLKQKKTIENIPTSKIRSIAMGLVEIFGLELYLDSILSFLQQKAPECLSLR